MLNDLNCKCLRKMCISLRCFEDHWAYTCSHIGRLYADSEKANKIFPLPRAQYFSLRSLHRRTITKQISYIKFFSFIFPQSTQNWFTVHRENAIDVLPSPGLMCIYKVVTVRCHVDKSQYWETEIYVDKISIISKQFYYFRKFILRKPERRTHTFSNANN